MSGSKMKKPSKNVVELQQSIRRNAFELQDYMKDMASWETKMKKQDKALFKAKKNISSSVRVRGRKPAPRSVRDQRAILTTSGPEASAAARAHREVLRQKEDGGAKEQRKQAKSAAAHVYDKGYKRWEKYDVDRALEELDQDGGEAVAEASRGGPKIVELDSKAGDGSSSSDSSSMPTRQTKTVGVRRRPKATRPVSVEEAEAKERKVGNAHFKRGEFAAASKQYTRCVALNPRSALAYSNRAMCSLRMRLFDRAEDDASIALVRFGLGLGLGLGIHIDWSGVTFSD